MRGEYQGTYRVADKDVLKYKDFGKVYSILFFKERLGEGLVELRKITVKGRVSDNTNYSMVVFEFFTKEGKYCFDLYKS